MKPGISRQGGNGNSLVGALHVLLLVAAAMPLLAGCDRLVSAERRIERAQEKFDVGQYAEAAADLKTALEAEPGNVSGRVLLARVALKLGDTATARKELDRAIEAGAQPASVRDVHYEIFLAQRRYDDALIAAATDDGLDPLPRAVVMARAQLGLGKHDEAAKSLGDAFAIDPDSRDASLVQSQLDWVTGKLPEAQAKLATLVERDPQDAEAWLYKGRMELGVGDAKQAIESFQQAQTHGSQRLDVPDQLSVLVGLVESRLALGDLPAAVTDLAELQRRAPNAFVTRYLNARLAYAKGENDVAVAELQRALSQQPDNTPARLLLGAALLAQGAVEQAEVTLNQLLAQQPDNVAARKLLARLYLSRDDPASASRVLAEAGANATVDAGTNWLEGASLLLSGNTAGAIDLLEKGAEADPDNVPLRLDLVQAYLSAGRREDALVMLASIPPGEGGLRRRQLSVLAEVAGRDLAEARPRIDRLMADNPQDSVLLATAASYLLGAGDTAGAARLFERAIAADQKNVEARLGLSSIALRSRDLESAGEQLRGVLEIEPSSERAHLGLAFVALVRGDRAEARDWLERAVSADPAVVESRLRLAEMSLADGDPVRAKALVDQALAVTKVRPATLARVGELYLAASQYDEAVARFNEAAALGEHDADASAGLALIALGKAEEARARLEAAAKKRPDWAAPLVYLAALDSGTGQFDQALKRVDAFQRAGGAPFVADEVRGNILLAARRPTDAVAAYERSAKARPSAALAIKLYQARRIGAQPDPAASLRAWLAGNPGDPLVRTLLAEHYQLTGDIGQAISQYERVLQVSPGAAAVMNNLAWLYYETGDARAEDLARRAHESAPAAPEIADTYGWILVEKGDVEAGLPVLEAAATGRPEHPEIRYHYAAALAKSGQSKAAAAALRRLLDEFTDFRSRPEAQELLDELARKELGL